MSEPITAAELRRTFDAVAPGTLGVEEEVMLVDPESLELAPLAADVLARLPDDPRFKLELPATQLEIVLGPLPSATELPGRLRLARAELAAAAAGLACPIAAGVHPTSPGVGELNRGGRYERTLEQYGRLAQRQLVCALQIHVAVGGAARSLAVYNALRSYLPLLAALAANAPLYEGRDTELASVRPMICRLLPRQGVPPPIESWACYADLLGWGARSGAFPEPASWWWELRPHPRYGTLELRVPDAQSSVEDAWALATAVQALVRWLAERHDAGEVLPTVDVWRIEENRWAACRYGVEGTMVDLESGERRPTREWLTELWDMLEARSSPDDAAGWARVRRLTAVNGAMGLRHIAQARGVRAATEHLVARFAGDERG